MINIYAGHNPRMMQFPVCYNVWAVGTAAVVIFVFMYVFPQEIYDIYKRMHL